MCGRFVVKSTTEVIRDMFGDYEVIEQYEPNFNIAPTALAPVFLRSKGRKQRRNLRWGLVPFFSKDAKNAPRMKAPNHTWTNRCTVDGLKTIAQKSTISAR